MNGGLVRARAGRVLGDCEVDFLERGLLLDVALLNGRQERLELGQTARRDDAARVQNRDPVGQVLGLIKVLRWSAAQSYRLPPGP